jgi:hypothetical protein
MMRLYRIIRYPPQYAKDMAESHQLYAVLESQQANTRHELRLVDKEIRDMRDSLKHLGTPPR